MNRSNFQISFGGVAAFSLISFVGCSVGNLQDSLPESTQSIREAKSSDERAPVAKKEGVFVETILGKMRLLEEGVIYSPEWGAVEPVGDPGDAWEFRFREEPFGVVTTSSERPMQVYLEEIDEWVTPGGTTPTGQRLFEMVSSGRVTSFPLVERRIFVSPEGGDVGDAGFTSPFGRVADALAMAEPGDAIVLLGGIYRESLRVEKSGTLMRPIWIKAHVVDGIPEKVVLQGSRHFSPGQDGFGDWEVHRDSIFKISVPSERVMDELGNFLFVNGEPMQLARFPNSFSFFVPDREEMVWSEEVHQMDEGLVAYTANELAGYEADAWTDAAMWFFSGYGWWGSFRRIAGSEPGKLIFTPPVSEFAQPDRDDPFILFDHLSALDEPGEWFLDTRGNSGPKNTLYVWMPDGSDPRDHVFELRHLVHGIYVDSAKHVRFENLNLVAAQIYSGPHASHIHFSGINSKFGQTNLEFWCKTASVEIFSPHSHFIDGTVTHTKRSAIVVNAANVTVKNSVFGKGMFHLVEGHVDNGMRYFQFLGNTVFESAEKLVSLNGYASTYSWNHVYNGAKGANDLANMNAHGNGDAGGSVVSYNWVHGGYGLFDADKPGLNGGFGIRYDAGDPKGSAHYYLHHNVVWNTTRHDISVWSQLSPDAPLYGNMKAHVYHNTVERLMVVAPRGRGNSKGAFIRNNIMGEGFESLNDPENTHTVLESNLTGRTPWEGNISGDPGFVDPASFNFSLRSDSIARGAGQPLPQFTDHFSDINPDLGAYAYGKPFWFPGARIRHKDVREIEAVQVSETRWNLVNIPIGRWLSENGALKVNGKVVPPESIHQRWNMATHRADIWVKLKEAETGVSTLALSPDGHIFEPIRVRAMRQQ